MVHKQDQSSPDGNEKIRQIAEELVVVLSI
jgi:hypothetical protein